ncbi:MAG: hypothetical protein P8I03_13070 [Thalassotalea sp.]|nr:hypothetical protein [Thalassotalea sp.]
MKITNAFLAGCSVLLLYAPIVLANWGYNENPSPNAFIHTGDITPQFQNTLMEAPEGIVYCGGQVKRQIEYQIRENQPDQWNAIINFNGDILRAMTAYSYFGNAVPPKGFVVALLGEDGSEFLVFNDGDKNWIEHGDYEYIQCN